MTKEEESKSLDTDISCEIIGGLSLFLTEVGDEAELFSEFAIKEEKVEEVMKELYKEITCSSCTNVNPTSPTSTLSSTLPSSSSSLSSLPFDVKSESCGASISESGSTVMAGIKFTGPPWNFESSNMGLSENEGWMVGRMVYNKNNVGFVEKKDGYDHALEIGDEWLARVLGWGPSLELED